MRHALAKAGNFELLKLDGEVDYCNACEGPINHSEYALRYADETQAGVICRSCISSIGALDKVMRGHELGMAGNERKQG